MHALYMLSLFATLIIGLNGTVTFITPTKADSWTVGQTKSISWTQISTADNPKGNYLSVRLWQVFPNTTTTPFFQYLIQQAVPNTVNVNPAGWEVKLDPTSGINSSVSNLYILALYLETQTNLLAQSDVFTIRNTTAASAPSSTSSISSASTTGSTATTTGFVTSTTPSSAAPTTTAAPVPPAAAGMSTGAKVGIAIGVSAAVIIGLAGGWFLSGWRRRKSAETAPFGASYYSHKQVPDSQASTEMPVDYTAVPQNPHISHNSGVEPQVYAELPGGYQGK